MASESTSVDDPAVTQLVVEMWKLLRAFDKAIADMPIDKAASRAAQARYSRDRFDILLSEMGIRLLTFEGQPFSAHLPLSAINGDELQAEHAIIESTIEPSLVAGNQVVHPGKVVLAEGSNVSRN